MPSFANSLLSISALTRDLNCKIEFFSYYFVFQDLQTGKTISTGRLLDGLYVLNRSQNFIKNQADFGDTDVNRKIL